MKTILGVVLLAFVAIAAASSAPELPKWPSAYKTQFDHRSIHNNSNSRGVWALSEERKAERWDFVFDRDRASVVRRYDLKKQYHMSEREGKVSCIESALNGTLEVPEFVNFTHARSFVIQGRVVDDWVHDDKQHKNDVTHYLDYKAGEVPLEFSDKESRMVFHHFDIGAQPDSEFMPPSECNKLSSITSAIEQNLGLGKCSIGQKLKCAGICALCAVACCVGDCIEDPLCFKCMGSAFSDCKICF